METLEARTLLTVAGLAPDLLEFSNPFWQSVEQMPAAVADAQVSLRASRFEPFTLDAGSLRATVADAPLEFTSQAAYAAPVISLPTPDGGFSRFRVVESPIMEPGLAAKFPEIKTYAGHGIDDPTASVRFDLTPAGFHAQVLSPTGSYNVEPYWHLDTSLYASYFHTDQLFDPTELLHEELDGAGDSFGLESITEASGDKDDAGPAPAAVAIGDELRTYRLAVAATGEFTAAQGGTVASAQARIVTVVNALNGIFQSEVAVRLVLVANNNQLIYTNAATDPYTNGSNNTMRGENQTTIDSIILDTNYDIGHVFGTGGGGWAGIGVVGTSGSKALAASGSTVATLVAHEMGHQFDARHTFNGTAGSCGNAGQYSAANAYEPGSGTTIMSYAGICGTDDVQTFSSSYFHSVSLDSIIDYTHTGDGNAAATITSTGNSIPFVDAGQDRTIPAATPFTVTSSSYDADPTDILTYSWEQRDLGPGTAQPLATPDDGSSPLFRSRLDTGLTRTFPRLSNLLAGTTPLGEQLPTTSRDLNFRVTVRDNQGGVDNDEMRVRVVDTGTPFRVTSPNSSTTWTGGATKTVRWDVAGTTSAPIDADFVNIRLSLNGGNTFPVLLVAGTPNDGVQTINVPNINTGSARIKVEAAGNIFFDISDANFTIESTPVEFNLLGINDNGFLFDVDQVTGIATNGYYIGVDSVVGLALRPDDGMFYTLTSSQNTIGDLNSLYRINRATGATTLVGPTGLANGIIEGDLDFDPRTGTLYGLVHRVGQNHELFTVDIETGAATVVGEVASIGDPSAMAFNDQGHLYVLDTTGDFDNLMRLSKSSGDIISQVAVSDLGPSAGIDFHPETGTLYVADGGSINATDSLHTLNIITGVLTSIGPTGLSNGLVGLEFIGPGEIHGTKWHDLDGDSLRDANDPGLPGWTIYLDQNNNSQLDATTLEPDDYDEATVLNNVIPEATIRGIGSVLNQLVDGKPDILASTGSLVFANPNSNTWNEDRQLRIDFTNPVSMVAIDFISDDSSDIGRLDIYNSGNRLLDTYFTADLGTGEAERMSLARLTADIAYAIASGDGNETGLLDNLVFGEPSTSTDANGEYSFIGLPPGPYTVAEVSQPGWEQVYPRDSGTHSVTVSPGGDVTANFGNQLAPGEIRGRKWYDLDGDGLSDPGERGLAGWRIYLDGNDNGVLDPITTTTWPGPGIGLPDVGTIPLPFVVSGLVGPIVDLNVTLGISHSLPWTMDAYLVSPAGTTVQLFRPNQLGVGGTLTFDDEGNDAEGLLSAFDGEDPNGVWYLVVSDFFPDGISGGLFGSSIEFDHGEQTTTTNANGDYRLRNLKPGTYTVAEVPKSPWEQTYPGGPGTHTVELDPGDTVTVDFGNRLPVGEIRGTNFNDHNGDGVRDAGDEGLPGWQIYLDGNENGLFEPVTTTTLPGLGVTLPDVGSVLLPLVVSGLTGPVVDLNVNLSIVHPSGLLDALLFSPAGNSVKLFSFGHFGGAFNITLDDEGLLAEGLLSQFDGEDPNGVWQLLFTDPFFDNFFGQVIGWSISFTHGEQVVTTDANGDYAFSGLKPNTYSVAEVQRPGWEQTYPDGEGTHVVVLGSDETVTANYGNRLSTDSDFDSDGDRDGFDFLLWQRGFGTPAPNAIKTDGDADADLDVDGDDLDIWENQFGQGVGPLVEASFDLFTVEISITDDDQGADSATSPTLMVNNVAPSISDVVLHSASINESETAIVTGTFNDPALGVATETFTGTDLGSDGISTALVINGAAGTFRTKRQFPDDDPTGTPSDDYTITVTVTDDDTGSDLETTFAVVIGAGVNNGVLQIVGSDEANDVTVNKQGNGLFRVHADFFSEGKHRTFDASTIDAIQMWLGDGDDHATIAGNIDTPASIYGGGGNDHLNGGGGRSILIGGLGTNRLVGGNRGDILIGDSTNIDESDAALLEVLDQWNSADPYGDRVAAVDSLLDVLDDSESDRLTGSSGRDLWFDGLGDDLTDVNLKNQLETVL